MAKSFPHPKRPAKRKALIATVTDVGELDGLQTMTISTAGVDRDGDRVSPEGMDARAYSKNPVLLWGHDYHNLPIGTVSALSVEPGVGVKAAFKFLDGDEFAARVENAWNQGAVRAASIGFRPQEWDANSTDGYDIKRWELLEVSLCPIPANPEAVRALKSLGVLPLEPGDALDLQERDVEEADAMTPTVLEGGDVKQFWTDAITDAKPYPNEHACRLRQPSAFQADSFRRMIREHEGKPYAVIVGRLEGETTMTEQAYRYPVDEGWTSAEARAHCQSHDGIAFEPASKADGEDLMVKGTVPSNPNDQAADEGEAWSAPTLGDFTDGSWDDLSASERSAIAKHFAWAAEMPPATYGSLKLPHHRASDGAAVWRGVANAMARANQASIPSADLGRVRAHLAAHYRQFDKPAPGAEAEVEIEKAGRIQAQRNEQRLRQMVALLNEMLSELQPAEAPSQAEPLPPSAPTGISMPPEDLEAARRKPCGTAAEGASVDPGASVQKAPEPPHPDPVLDLIDAPAPVDLHDAEFDLDLLQPTPDAPVVYEVDPIAVGAATKAAIGDLIREAVASAIARARGRVD